MLIFSRSCRLLIFLLVLGLSAQHNLQAQASNSSKVHIVYLGHKLSDLLISHARRLHLETLGIALGRSLEECDKVLHYSYSRGFNGFAASLDEAEVKAVLGMPGVVSVYASNMWELSTTRSFEFLGLDPVDPAGTWQLSQFGSGVVIGIMDSGIWPESASFSADGMPPPPLSWKGGCAVGESFNSSFCNNKLVGAKYYYAGFLQQSSGLGGSIVSARDEQGHGTHVASTAGGALVQGASFGGLALGDARGGAPLAHVAMYKVCWMNGMDAGCTDADILAAFDDAIADGVDVISLSIAGKTARSYFRDGIAIGSYHAMQNGILVIVAGGNNGPDYSSVVNVAPWLTTVAASTIDRRFPATVTLGNALSYTGYGVNLRNLSDKPYPLVYAATAGLNSSQPGSCGDPQSLNPSKVAGAIVLCLSDDATKPDLTGPAIAGAVGMILPYDYLITFSYDIPACLLPQAEADVILLYIQSTRSPVSTMETSTLLNYAPSPIVAPFSGQGPNPLNSGILKPDVIAPGVNILAAWTPLNPPTGDLGIDNRSVAFNIISGTSMATPHVTGLAALLVYLHRDWSPAAIRSALMTTATLGDNLGNGVMTDSSGFPSDPFGFGAGLINPVASPDPGLVYDLSESDYHAFLCTSEPLDQASIPTITGSSVPCPTVPTRVGDLNYPTVAMPNLISTETVTRTVTNVGPVAIVNYTVAINNPPGVTLLVTPDLLSFTSLGQKLPFSVQATVVDAALLGTNSYAFGFFSWSDGTHSVRSIVAVQGGALPVVFSP